MFVRRVIFLADPRVLVTVSTGRLCCDPVSAVEISQTLNVFVCNSCACKQAADSSRPAWESVGERVRPPKPLAVTAQLHHSNAVLLLVINSIVAERFLLHSLAMFRIVHNCFNLFGGLGRGNRQGGKSKRK